MVIAGTAPLNLSNPQASSGYSGRPDVSGDPFGLNPPRQSVNTSSLHAARDANQVHFPDGALNPVNAENRVLLFDIDETLAARVTKAEKKKLEKAGYKVYDIGLDEKGKADEFPYFIERPGAKELMKKLINEGFVIVASSRNLPHHVDHVIKALGFGKLLFHRFDRYDLNDKRQMDFKKYPNHSNNIGMWSRFTDWLSRNTVGWFSDAIRWVKSLFTKREAFRNTPAGTVNKYPPALCGARVLFDDKSENTDHAKRSGDWVHAQIKPFHGTVQGMKDSEERDADGNYKWWAEILKTTDVLRDRGWQDLFKTTYNKEPKITKVEVDKEFNDKLSRTFGFRV